MAKPIQQANKPIASNWEKFKQKEASFPRSLLIFLIGITVSPFLLNLLGFSFESTNPLSGAFHHTILEWSAFCAAIFTAILAFNHYIMTKDVTTPVIGFALFMAGCMDAFHTLAASRLIAAIADNKDLVPFTWAICRFFHAAICLLGVGILLLRKEEKKAKGEWYFVLGIGAFFIILAYTIIRICAVSDSIPQTQFPDALIARPWDIYPLIFYCLGSFIFWKFFQRSPSVFSFSLIISLIPNIAVQLHMAFGSTTLYDNHFNVAHFLKIISYLVPLIGLVTYYTRIYGSSRTIEKRLEVAIDSAFAGIFFMDFNGVIRLTNKNIENYFDYKEDQLKGRNFDIFIPPKSLEEHKKFIANVVQSGKSQRLGGEKKIHYWLKKNGAEVPVDISVSHIKTNLEHLLMVNVQDITERVQYQKELRNRNKEIEQFIYTVSHDLKSPIVTITGFLKYLEKDLQDNKVDKALDSLKRIGGASGKMTRLVQDLLEFSRTGHLKLDIKNLDLKRLISTVLEERKVYIEEKKVKVILEDLGMIHGDEDRLRQVFENLVGNALKHAFNGENPCLIIGIADEDPSTKTFYVKDNGPGIPKEYQETVFRLFQRLDTDDTEGTGVGLAIVQKIISLHEGKVWIESEKGRGSTFFVKLKKEINLEGPMT